MGKTTISFNLSENSVRNAIRELEQYQRDFNYKIGLVVRSLTEIGFKEVRSRLPSSQNVSEFPVTWNDNVKIMEIMASGELVLFFEFGAGIYYNETLDNPLGTKYGMGVGTYPNQTHAFDENGWYYQDDGGEWHHSYGVQATMPLYKAQRKMKEMASAEIRKVFK